MIEIDEMDSGLYVTDVAKNELTIRMDDWERGGEPVSLPHEVDEVIAGRVSELRVPKSTIAIEVTSDETWTLLDSDWRPARYESDDYVVKVNWVIAAYIRFRAPVAIERNVRSEDIVIRLPRRTAVTIGFRSGVRSPARELVVPPTVDGVATAISHLSSTIRTTTPDKSYPSLRRHPPSIAFGESTRIPAEVRENRADTGIAARVPADLESLFVISPLAYYLQAEVVPEPRGSIRLEMPEVDAAHRVPPLPNGQYAVAELLRTVFSLDCLVRNAGPYSTDLAELTLLDSIPLAAEDAYDATPAERLAMYLETPFERIESAFPDWHLAMYVDPVLEHLPTLSPHLDRLAAVYLPAATPLETDEFLRRSIDECYESAGTRGSVGVVEPILPRLEDARAHGWQATGVPIDAFKAVLQSYDNRAAYLDRPRGLKRISVVLNAPEMESEQAAVKAIYEERAAELSIDLQIERELDGAGLERVLTSGADFVHYIGHCTSAGLQCTDGHLPVADLDTVDAQTFFLNACGSYDEGIALVEKGSVAGAVTLEKVLHRQATKVGTAFARLIIHGFSIDRALEFARREAIMNKGYLVVGDGTHTLSQGQDLSPASMVVESRSPDRFSIVTDTGSTTFAGAVYQSYLPDVDQVHLAGNPLRVEVSRETLLEYLDLSRAPVIFDGRFFWSDDLETELRTEGP